MFFSLCNITKVNILNHSLHHLRIIINIHYLLHLNNINRITLQRLFHNSNLNFKVNFPISYKIKNLKNQDLLKILTLNTCLINSTKTRTDRKLIFSQFIGIKTNLNPYRICNCCQAQLWWCHIQTWVQSSLLFIRNLCVLLSPPPL